MRAVVKAPIELKPDELSDVSWINTETPDGYGHVVFAKAMNNDHLAFNPVGTPTKTLPRETII